MNNIFSKINNQTKIFAIFLAIFMLLHTSLFAKGKENFRQVEATGRSIILPDNLETSRKRALEDALYVAALKGGADINGFSSISSNTIINDQSVVRATNSVIDFKILSETQDKEFLIINISAIVGDELSKINCKNRPLNITLLKGIFRFDSNVETKLGRYLPIWYNQIYEIISSIPNINITNHKDKSVEQITQSSINRSFNYKALINGLPKIQSGDYSIVPKLFLTKINQENDFLNYLLKVTYEIYKGQKLELIRSRSYDLPIKYQFSSKFQFILNISTANIDNIDKIVREHMNNVTNDFLKEITCMPLEGKLSVNDEKLIVNLGRNQGIKQRQIGLVKGINIKNSMLNNSSVIVHTDNIFDNYSTLLPLNNDVKLTTLNNLIVKFVE